MRPSTQWLLAVGLVLATEGNAYAQGTSSRRPSDPFINLSAGLQDQVSALGDRLRRPGKEKVVLSGIFEDRSQQRVRVRVTFQLPAVVRIEGLNPGGPALDFLGGRAQRQSPANEDLLETLAADTAEGMFASITEGAAVVLLGRKFKPNVVDYSGPQYDIYEVTGPVRSGMDPTYRLKRYYFDSKTALLAKTHYRDERRALDVEVRFSDWQTIEGAVVPGRIERYENNQFVFSIVFTTVLTGPWQDPAQFQVLENALD